MTRPPAAGRLKAYLSRLDERLDEALEETFPASDPLAVTAEPDEGRRGDYERASERGSRRAR